ncbi:hypothetical protein ACFSVN_08795 [Gracilimonas halophila]|uniref:Uncharacterized protein n=2 Tax=Gracilimonas halophila TaxID=1834464 RepID=A0ABW5JLD0_9BACT
MSAIVYLIGSTVMFFTGFYIGFQKGHENGYSSGFDEGVNATLNEMDRFMKGGLKSPLDWETAQQLMREKMSKN